MFAAARRCRPSRARTGVSRAETRSSTGAARAAGADARYSGRLDRAASDVIAARALRSRDKGSTALGAPVRRYERGYRTNRTRAATATAQPIASAQGRNAAATAGGAEYIRAR